MLGSVSGLLEDYGYLFVEGVRNTLIITVFSYTMGLVLGLLLGVLRVYGPRPLRPVIASYVEVFRGTPMVVQLFIVYYSLPALGLKLDPLTAAIIAIGLNSAAYQAEYFRGAIGSIPRGQWEAALSLGMRRTTAVRIVVIPQMFRVAIPALTNELVYLLKYSSIAYFITVPELVYVGKQIGSKTYMYLEVYTIIALIYVILALLVSEASSRIEKRMAIPGVSVSTRFRE